jgi:hypothetical protein
MADLFTTNVMMGVIASLIEPPSFLLDKFFNRISNDPSEEIHFDVIAKTRRLTPFVSPLVEGKIVESQGFTTNTFKPAYLKDKRVWDASRALKRSAGEQIGGSLSPMDRMRALLAFDLQDQVQMLTRRQEVMAAQALISGTVTVSGDLYATQVVNFGRQSANTIVLTGGALWDATGVNPLDNLQDWALIVLQACGAMPTDVIMDVDAWKIFRANPIVAARLALQRTYQALPTLDQAAKQGEGGVLMGVVDGFSIYVYAGYYLDASDVTQRIIPSRTVLLATPQIEGVRAYGAIRDEEAGFQSVAYYAKSWIVPDPAVRYLLMQSAPLVVPTRPNASIAATV